MTDILEKATGGPTPKVHRLPDRGTGGPTLNDWSALRDKVDVLGDDVTDHHRAARRRNLDESTTVIGQGDPRELLDELATAWGLSWTTIARLVGVTPAAVRKWRRGENITGTHRRALARALAFLELATRSLNPLHDAASWLEMPISDDVASTAVDAYAAGYLDELLDFATGQIGPHELLDRIDPQWRAKADESFSIQRAQDGMPAIVEGE